MKPQHLLTSSDELDPAAPCQEPVRMIGEARLPSRFGDFRILGFEDTCEDKEHVAIVHGELKGAANVLTRLHSECLTGDALGSLRCDCRDQLEFSLQKIAAAPCGVVLYMRQEGRGIGLLNKIRAYALQDQGMDTVEANRALGFQDDLRSYEAGAAMLKQLQVRSIVLMTNNPDKVRQLKAAGVSVARREPHLLPSNPHNRAYLRTKRDRSGHLIDLR